MIWVISCFSHANEKASPGYYGVLLDEWKIKCELSATQRTGWHKYSYPAGKNAGLLIDLEHILRRDWGNDVTEGWIKVVNDRTIEGYHLSTRWAARDPLWFRAEFNAPFEVVRLHAGGVNQKKLDAAEGVDIRLWLSFGELKKPLEIKVALSSVDEAGPRNNMEEVSNLKSFDEVVTKAVSEWEEALSAIQIKSGDPDVLTNFYTAMYHAHLAPILFSDADGRYLGMDQKIHTTTKRGAYTAFSLWDTFRAWFPLMTIIRPDDGPVWIDSLYQGSREGGLLPKWPLNGNYTGTMVAYPALSVIADGMSKGLVDSNRNELVEASIRTATWQPEWHEKVKGTRAEGVMHKNVMYKEKLGFAPADKCYKSVSWGLEMAYYDWCLGRMLLVVGNKDLADVWNAKGQGYHHYFDASTGFMRGKRNDGSWVPDFNPFSSDKECEYIEGNAYQWTPFVPHDIDGLRDLLGGKAAMGRWLDVLFTTPSVDDGKEVSADITGLIGQYAHGNEPSHHVAYLYNHTDRPWRAAEVIDKILYEFYLPSPEGIIGNEDCGQMSAWYVMSAMGFYQTCPGDPVYDLGRPVVDEARIRVGGGWFTIKVDNNNRKNLYIEKVILNGKELEGRQFRHDDIKPGGTLEIFMSPTHGK